MYEQIYQAGKQAKSQNSELTPQIVGALMRRFAHITHPSQNWGNRELDSTIPNIEELAATYPYAQLMKWILVNHREIEKTYSSRWATMWNAADKIAVDVSAQGAPLLLVEEKGQVQEKSLLRGMMETAEPTEQLSHQLASAIVAMSPPADQDLKTGKVTVPGVCDATGALGCPINVVPYVPLNNSTPQMAEATRDGGPLMRAYKEKNGGIEGLVSRLEGALNAPKDTSVMSMHTSLCKCIHQKIEAARKEHRFPPGFAPITFSVSNGKEFARLQYQTKFQSKPFSSLDQMYMAHNMMAKSVGINGRAGHVHDGHFFADMPPGVAKKIHQVGNIMDGLAGLGNPFVRLDTVTGPLQKLKVLLPLNVNCSSPVATVKFNKNKPPSGFGDPRFVSGHYVPFKGMPHVTYRVLEGDKAPTISGGKAIYSPSNVAQEITNNLTLVPSTHNNIVGFVVHAQNNLWSDKRNCIVPLNYCDGTVIVYRGESISDKSLAHVAFQDYLARAALFFFTRIIFPFSRLPWPQVSGLQHSRVTIKYGEISATDNAFSQLMEQLMGGKVVYEDTTALYETAWSKDIPPALQPATAKPAPMPKAPKIDIPDEIINEDVAPFESPTENADENFFADLYGEAFE